MTSAQAISNAKRIDVSSILEKEAMPGRPVPKELIPRQVKAFKDFLKELEKSPEVQKLMQYLAERKAYIPCSKFVELFNSHHSSVSRSKKVLGDIILTEKGFKIRHQIEKRFKRYHLLSDEPDELMSRTSNKIYRLLTAKRLAPLLKEVACTSIRNIIQPAIEELMKGESPEEAYPLSGLKTETNSGWH